MKRYICYKFETWDPFTKIETDYDFQLGDIVYYSMPKIEHEKEIKATKNIDGYPSLSTELEGEVILRWIDLNDNEILFQVRINQ